MKYSLLITVAAAALVTSGIATQAQENPRHEEKPGAARTEARPAEAPKAESREMPRAAQMNERKEEGAAPNAASKETKEKELPRAAQSEQPKKPGTENETPKRMAEPSRQEKSSNDRAAQSNEERTGQRSAERPAERPSPRTGAADERQQQGERTGAAEQRNSPRAGADEGRNKERAGAAEGRGQPKVAGKVQTSQEHATRMTELLMRNSRSEKVDIDINVGVRVPDSITIRPLPSEVLLFAPEYRGYDYFISNDEVVFVAPDLHEIVGTIEYEGRAAAVDETTHVAGARPCPVEN